MISETYSGRFINEYHNIESLNKGGFGYIYKGTHNIDNVVYAIKQIPILLDITVLGLNLLTV